MHILLKHDMIVPSHAYITRGPQQPLRQLTSMALQTQHGLSSRPERLSCTMLSSCSQTFRQTLQVIDNFRPLQAAGTS